MVYPYNRISFGNNNKKKTTKYLYMPRKRMNLKNILSKKSQSPRPYISLILFIRSVQNRQIYTDKKISCYQGLGVGKIEVTANEDFFWGWGRGV